MLEYLKQVISEQMAEQNKLFEAQSDVSNDTILEYASMFQELGDLSEAGTAALTSVRTPISIPIDDDIEIESIEINLGDGRITDIPADATVQEDAEILAMIGQQYKGMKHYQEFYDHEYYNMPRRPRESEDRFRERVTESATNLYRQYTDYIYQEGVFGGGKIKVNDLAVPDKIYLNFGKGDNGKDYTVTVPVLYEVDKKQRVTKKQIDSVKVWSHIGTSSFEKLADSVFEYVGKKFNVPAKKKKWDVLTPVGAYIPIEPKDEYIILIGFEVEYQKDYIFGQLSIPIKAITKKNDEIGDIPNSLVGRDKIVPSINKNNFIRKRDFQLEQAEMSRPVRRSRFYQEAIDFGGADPNAAAAPTDQAASPANDAGVDVNVDANTQTPDTDAVPANVNDVSDQIAEKVSQNTDGQNQDVPTGDETIDVDMNGNTDDIDVNIDTDTTGDTDIDIEDYPADTAEAEPVDTDDTGADVDIDSEIDSLDAGDTGADSSDIDSVEAAGVDTELDSMTIDELLAQGSEKLKTMTLSQLKEFISSPDGTTPDEVSEYFVSESTKPGRSNRATPDNIKKRIVSILEEFNTGLTILHDNFKSGKMMKSDIRKWWMGDHYGGSSIGGAGLNWQIQLKNTPVMRRISIDLYRFFAKINRHRKLRNVFSEEQQSKLKKFTDSVKEFINMLDIGAKSNKERRADFSISDIDKAATELLGMSKEISGFTEKLANMVVEEFATMESDGYSVEDEKILFESFFTDASNIGKRITTSINDVIPGLEKIKKNCANGKWNRYKLREYWDAVPNEDDDGTTSELRKGNRFSTVVETVQHFLKVCDKKRAQGVINTSDLDKIHDCNVQLENFSRLCNRACKGNYVKYDVDMKEVADMASLSLDLCQQVAGIFRSEAVKEYYISEAAFITKKNINKELLSHLKITLGILNNTENDFRTLVNSFKDEAKKMNKLLTKTQKFNKMYTMSELKEFRQLNSILLNLSTNIKANNLNDTYTEKVKSIIKSYTAQAKVVADIIEKKMGIVKADDFAEPKSVNEEAGMTSGTSTTLADIAFQAPTQPTSADVPANASVATDTPSGTSTDSAVNFDSECGDTDNTTPTESNKDSVSTAFEEFMNMF